MGYFRENTAIVEAEEWDASNIKPNGLIDIGLHSGSLRRNPDGTLLVRTSYGDYNANPGDLIVKNETGKLLLPCSKEVLENSYTPVTLQHEVKNETVYSTEDKNAIIKALEAVASALSFCDTEIGMEAAMANKLDDLYDAISELKGTDPSFVEDPIKVKD